MNHSYTLKKNIWTTKISLFSKDKLVGTASNKTFSSTLIAEAENLKLEFRPKGMIEQEYQIISQEDQKTIGKVRFHTWKSKGTIDLNDKQYTWKMNNLWDTKWSILEDNQELARFKSSMTKGSIESETEDIAILMTGLFLHNRFQGNVSFIFLAIVFIPIFISIF